MLYIFESRAKLNEKQKKACDLEMTCPLQEEIREMFPKLTRHRTGALLFSIYIIVFFRYVGSVMFFRVW